MRTIETNIYTFGELSADAKVRAIQDYQASEGYMSQTDAFLSINKLAEHFGGKVSDYSVDFFASSHSSMKFDMPEMDAGTIEEKLAALGAFNPETLQGLGDCKLTGYCEDESGIDGFRVAFMRYRERDLEKLMQAAFKNWLVSTQEDCASDYEDENFGEHCDANDYEFYENGEMAPADSRASTSQAT